MKEQDLRALAKESGISERGVSRLLGSVSLPARKTRAEAGVHLSDSTSSIGRDVGLRLQEVAARRGFSRGIPQDALEHLGQVLKEYHACCPRVTEWVGRGDFKADRPIEGIEESAIGHAARTAGRLRAQVLRRFGE